MPPTSPIPPARPTDDEDISWALSTAQTSWGRGDAQEALKWLKRAAEAAADNDDDMRALELAKAISELTTIVGTIPPSPASVPPPLPKPSPQVKALTGARAPAVTPKAPAVTPKAAPVAPKPSAGAKPAASGAPKPGASSVAKSPSVRPPAPTAVAPKRDEKKDEKKDDRKRGGRKSVPSAEETALTHVAPADEGTDTNLRAVKKVGRRSYDDLTRPAAPHEIEAMQTQTMRADELPDLDYEEAGRTRVGASHFRAAITAERGGLGLIAAARVFLVRAPDGEIRVSLTPVEGGVAVAIVPLEAAVDLHELFGR